MGKDFDYQGVANTVASNRANAQYAGMFQNIADTALEIFNKHLADKQADQMQAELFAPKAVAITSDGQPLAVDRHNAVYQDVDGNTSSTPPAVPTRDQEEAHNVNARAPGYEHGFSFDPDETPTVPNMGGVQGLQLRQALQTQKVRTALANAQLTGDNARNANALTTADLLKSRLAISNAKLNGTLPATNAASNPYAADRLQLGRDQLNLRKTIEQRRANVASGSAVGLAHHQDLDKLDDQWFRTNANVPLTGWGDWTDGAFVNAAGKQDANGTYFTARAPGDKADQRSIRMPRVVFEEGQQQRYPAYIQRVGTPRAAAQPPNAQQMYQSTIGANPATGGNAGGGAGGTTAGSTPADLLNDARTAISRGADPKLVKGRLDAMNIDTSNL